MSKIIACTQTLIDELVENFAERLDGVRPNYYVKSRPDSDYLVFEFAQPSERFYGILESLNSSLENNHPLRDRCSIAARQRKPPNVINLPETRLLQRELSESLTVDRNTFGNDFLLRYTQSVTNHEENIVGKANYLIYGRRGAGKSSLLAYSMHWLKKRSQPYSWIAMQGYSGRSDIQAVASVLAEIFHEASRYVENKADFLRFRETLLDLGESSGSGISAKIERMVPRLRSSLGAIASPQRPFTIFLDDLHVLAQSLQPYFLSILYSISRDNNIYIKASGIEQFTQIWDGQNQRGMQSPHDIQILNLDYNLTMPDRSREHIKGILDAHAKYCGFPTINYIADDAVISRLVLVAAAVPRDALSLFSKAINKSSIKGQKAVSLTSINAAASETVEEKLRDIERDYCNGRDEVGVLLDRVKKFCISSERINAFLVRIDNASLGFSLIQKLIALRLVHVLHEGITPDKAGERYIALMLDFGFYVGIRAARSVKLFPDTPRILLAKDLRKLPIFKPDLVI